MLNKEMRELRAMLCPDNPFDDRYVKKELRWFGKRSYAKNGVVLSYSPLVGRCDDYLNKNYRANEDMNVPRLFIDNRLWMSLSPMEIQSQYLTIQRCAGRVAIAGLGLGYAALKMAAKGEVEELHVWEIDQRVIDFFQQTFNRRKGFKKIQIYNEDARVGIPAEASSNWPFDYIYCDIYDVMLPDQVIPDFKRLSKCVLEPPTGYYFWGMERVIADAMFWHRQLRMHQIPLDLRFYFLTWTETPAGIDLGGRDITLDNLYEYVCSPEFCEEVIALLELGE